LGAIVNVFVERVAGVAKGLRELFSGDIRQGLRTIGQQFLGIASDAREAASAAIDLRRELEDIGNAEADLARRRAAAGVKLVELKALQDDETESIKKRQGAAAQAFETQKDFLNEEIALAERTLQAANDAAEATKEQRRDKQGNIALTEEQIAAEIRLSNARTEATRLNIDASKTQAGFERQAEDNARKAREEARKAAEARQRELEALQRQAAAFLRQLEALERAQLTGITRIRAEREAAIRQIDEQEAALRESFKKLGLEFNLAADFERQRAVVNAQASKEIRETLRAEEKERQDILARQAEREADAQAKARAERLKELDTFKQIAQARADLERFAGLTEEQATIARARRKLNIEIDFARERLKILEAQFGPNSPEVVLLRAQIQLLEREYAEVGNIDLSAFDKLKQRILDALQIDEQQLGALKDASSQALSALTDLASGAVDVQIAQQDRLLQSIRGRIRETESALREEQRRAERGYANDARLLEQALEEQLRLEAEAERKRAELQEKQTKATVRQNQIEAVSEYGKLVISLLAAQAKGGVLGIGLAVGALALVARIIAQQRAVAAAAVQGFREGTPYVQGPGTANSDSVPAMLSRGERVIPARMNESLGGRSMTNKELADYVNLGRLAEKAFGGAAQVAALNRQAADREEKKTALELAMNYGAMAEAYREAAQASAEKVVEAIQAQPVVIPMGDRTRVERNLGNVKKTDTFLHNSQK
jgi:hypothetical protein